MQNFEWTTQWIALAGEIGLALVGFGLLLALLWLGRKNVQLTSQLENVLSQNNELQTQLHNARELCHQQALSESRTQQQLLHAQVVEQRLNQQVTEYKQAEDALRQALDESRREQHSALAANSALQEQQKDLRERLVLTESALEQERTRVNTLKEGLAQEGKKAKAFEATAQETREQLQDHKRMLREAAEKHDALQERLSRLGSEYTRLQTERQEREASHARELANFEQQKSSLAEQFKLLSQEILEAKTQNLQETSKLTLGAIMSPFQQSIDSFKKEVQEIHHRETTQQGELRKELESLKQLNQKITAEAHELSTALRGQKKLQGNWGELVLENVLDRSGLRLGKDYQREFSITTEDGRSRPDAVVFLPQQKHLIIDAKVSLNAYTRYVNEQDDLARAQALKEHVQAVGNRIKELAARDYYKLPGLNSPEMVFMFIPIESAFVEALKADETLFQQAIENNVLVATPTTLLTSLNIVRQLWRYEDQNKHTAALANKAESVFKKLNGFLGSFEKIKKGLDSAAQAYSTAENQLISGKGNLVKQVGEFKNLAPAIKAELPDYFVDKAALEIDFIPPQDEPQNTLEGELLREGDFPDAESD